MKKISIVLLSIFILAGCGTNTTTCTSEENGMLITEVFTSKDDKITKQVTTALLEMDTTTVDPSIIQNLEDSLRQSVEGVEGLTFTFNTTPTEVSFEIEIDFAKADLAQLAEMGLVTDGTADYVSLKELIAAIEMNPSTTCNTK